MAENSIYDVIIIGGGPGGLTAAIYAMRGAMKTLLIEKGIPGGQVVNSAEVENYPGFEHVEGAELSMKFAQHAQSYGLEMLQQEVVALARGESDRFTQVLEAYAASKDVTIQRIYLETMEQVLGGTNKVIIDSNGAGGANGVIPYLPLPDLERRARERDAAAGTARDLEPAERGFGARQEGATQ